MGILDGFMNMDGEMFTIERDGVVIDTVKGLLNVSKQTGKKMCNFYPDTDIKPNDWLIRLDTGERFFVDDVSTVRFAGKLESKDAYYLTEREYQMRQKQISTAAPVFHIQNAYGSVIGTENNVTVNYHADIEEIRKKIDESDSSDNEELKQIVSLLEMIVNNQVPVQKGLFSRFSAVMERNSWITSAVAGAIMSWLTTLLP